MHTKFWHKRWATNDIPWHEDSGNSLLLDKLSALSLRPSDRIFVPLCGKTLDIGWLLEQGFSVVAIELSKMAVDELFEQLDIVPKISQQGSLSHYSASNLDVFVGDFFALSVELLGHVDAIFDRACLVALPIDMRLKYTQYLANITANAPQLLIVFEYDQNQMAGPPFSISLDEIKQHYSQVYSVSLLGSLDMTGQLRGDFVAEEKAYLLQR
ncbi:MAG: thiopurine S-methyltransferase [Arenicella sp.]|jgi:thiopurine S-methyltransferase